VRLAGGPADAGNIARLVLYDPSVIDTRSPDVPYGLPDELDGLLVMVQAAFLLDLPASVPDLTSKPTLAR